MRKIVEIYAAAPLLKWVNLVTEGTWQAFVSHSVSSFSFQDYFD